MLFVALVPQVGHPYSLEQGGGPWSAYPAAPSSLWLYFDKYFIIWLSKIGGLRSLLMQLLWWLLEAGVYI